MIEPDQQLYHGTAHRFGLGGQVNPGHPSNYAGVTDDVNAERVYATTDLSEAYTHARNASDIANQGKTVWRNGFSPEDTGEPNGIGKPVYRPSAPRVYPVANTGPLDYDSETTQGLDPDDLDPDEMSAYQSHSPLKITGADVGAEARSEYTSNFGPDIGMPQPSRWGDPSPGQDQPHWNAPLNASQFGGMHG